MVCVQIVTEKWNPISAAIRFSTRSWASHAEFTYADDIGCWWTLGARADGVRVRLAARDHYSKTERFTAEGIEDAFQWARTQVGKPYDYSAISGIATDRDWHSEGRWFCSELVAAAFEHAGHPLLSTRPSLKLWRITPRDLLLSRQLVYIR